MCDNSGEFGGGEMTRKSLRDVDPRLYQPGGECRAREARHDAKKARVNTRGLCSCPKGITPSRAPNVDETKGFPHETPCPVPIPGRIEEASTHREVERRVNRRKEQVQCSKTERPEVIDTGEQPVGLEGQQVMADDRAHAEHDQCCDPEQRRATVGLLPQCQGRSE